MKIRADEHVSLKLVETVRTVAIGRSDLILSSVYESDQRGMADHHWITEFADEGGHAILSADTDFFMKHQQVLAVEKTGLRVVWFAPPHGNAKLELQTANVLTWWPRIEAKLREARSREFWDVTWGIRDKLELRQRKVDFQSHRKKQKKQTRRSR
jgi:hypothetical protein